MVFNVVVFTRAGVATARKARGALAACKTLGIPSNMLELFEYLTLGGSSIRTYNGTLKRFASPRVAQCERDAAKP